MDEGGQKVYQAKSGIMCPECDTMTAWCVREGVGYRTCKNCSWSELGDPVDIDCPGCDGAGHPLCTICKGAGKLNPMHYIFLGWEQHKAMIKTAKEIVAG